jgi:hypothetical protein
MGWDDSDVFGGDAFGEPTADCFGHAIEDADPFLEGNDSFGGDKEWTTFNDGNGEEEDNGGHHHHGNKQVSSRTTRDVSRNRNKTCDTNDCRSRTGHGLPPSHRLVRPGAGSRSSPKEMGKRAERQSYRHSTSPATKSAGKRITHDGLDGIAIDTFVPEDAGDNPFRIGMDSPGRISPIPMKFTARNSGFAEFDTDFDVSPRMSQSPTPTNGSSSSTRIPGKANVLNDRHRRAQRLTSTEDRDRSEHSESRRMSSLRNSQDEDDSDLNPGLSTFLSEKSGRSYGRRRRGLSSNDSAGGNSTQSAPAANQGHYQRRQHSRGSTKQSSHDDGYALHQSASSSPRRSPKSRSSGKSLRERLPPSGAQRRTRGTNESRASATAAQEQSQQQILSLDVSTLAEHGRLEVVDGKMRLVVDIDTIAR